MARLGELAGKSDDARKDQVEDVDAGVGEAFVDGVGGEGRELPGDVVV